MDTASTHGTLRAGVPPRLVAWAIVLAVLATWWTSLPAPFELDDHESILANATIRRFPSLDWLHPPASGGETVSGRPVLNLSFAINHALHGLDVRGFRLTNMFIHAAAALALFGIVRRTLARADRNDTAAREIALVVALIWALHPLQTAAVTYVVQRAESLAGLFYLLTLYGFIRAAERDDARPRWFVVSALACWLGVLTKETVATAPLVVFLYDRAFVSGSWRAAWRNNGRLHAMLVASWIAVAALALGHEGRGGSAGLDTSIAPVTYFLTQCEAIVRYVRLAFWPAGQVFDYGVPTVASVSEVWMQLALLAIAGGATVWLIVRNHAAGFAGACFFLLLGPSSSFVPVATQTMAEHRMYLALAPIVVVVVCGGRLTPLPKGIGALAAMLVMASLAIATVARNGVYRSEIALWRDTARKRPENPRAQHNLGRALHEAGEVEPAMAAFRRAIAVQPNHAFAHFSLGTILASRAEWEGAMKHLRAAVEADANDTAARMNLGRVLMQLGRDDEARVQFQAAVREDPHLAPAQRALGHLLAKVGELDGAAEAYQAALNVEPSVEAHFALGNLLARARRIDEAMTHYRSALELDSEHVGARNNLANALFVSRRFEEAAREYEEVLRRDPQNATVRENLAQARQLQGAVR